MEKQELLERVQAEEEKSPPGAQEYIDLVERTEEVSKMVEGLSITKNSGSQLRLLNRSP